MTEIYFLTGLKEVPNQRASRFGFWRKLFSSFADGWLLGVSSHSLSSMPAWREILVSLFLLRKAPVLLV